MKKILIVDDEENMQKVLSILFRREKYKVTTASNGEEAVNILKASSSYDLILSDLKMPRMDGIELLKHLNMLNIDIPFILITAYGSISEAVGAMKLGAVDFITKPFNKEDLKNIVHRTLFDDETPKSNQPEQFQNDAGVIYTSDTMRKIMETVRKIAPSNLTILLTGESGTGKGVIAKSIHDYAFPSSGTPSPFISINCPALPDNLLESELFGYKKGAFTGADKDYPGKVSMANGGTLFLDEIGDLSLTVQSKLLKLLEEGVYSPLGSMKEYKAHIRIISASNQSLIEMIKEKRFREDLYYRINSVILEIPPLCKRKEDILPLAYSFLKRFSSENGKAINKIADEVMDLIQAYNWPGNIRELRNVIHRAVVLSSNTELTKEDLPGFQSEQSTINEKPGRILIENERKLILDVLKKNTWNISASARELHMSRGSLRHRMEKYALQSG